MSIRRKLTLGYLLIVILLSILALYSVYLGQSLLEESVGKKSIFLAAEIISRINNMLEHTTDHLEQYSKQNMLIDFVIESNKALQLIENPLDYILSLDQQFRYLPPNTIPPFIANVIDNPVSQQLSHDYIDFWKQKKATIYIPDMIITNQYGAVIAKIGKMSDYYYGNTIWFKNAKNSGRYMGDVDYDSNAMAYVIPIAIRLVNQKGEFIGVIKAMISLSTVIRKVKIALKYSEQMEIQIISLTSKKLIYSTKAFQFLEDVSNEPFMKNIKGTEGFFKKTIGTRQKLFSYITTSFGKNATKLQWLLIISHDQKEIFGPVILLRNRIVIVSSLLIIMGFIISILLSRSISKPIMMLKQGAEIIGSGNLDYKTGLSTGDEIGDLSKSIDQMTCNLKNVTASRNELQREIEERIKTEHALEIKTKELERSNTELEEFAYVASHDLQEPLRMISSYLQLLERRYKGKFDQDADDFIHYAVDGAKRLQILINDLLTYSRLTTRGKPFKMVDLNHVFKTTLIQLTHSIQKTNPNIICQPLPQIMADEIQLTQLFQNLIHNAIKFCDQEQPIIEISCEDKGDFFQFAVKDNGIGIDPDYHSKIFQIFRRLHGVGKFEGTGVGLALCKKIIERHNGTIWVESEPGQGSTFYFTLKNCHRSTS